MFIASVERKIAATVHMLSRIESGMAALRLEGRDVTGVQKVLRGVQNYLVALRNLQDAMLVTMEIEKRAIILTSRSDVDDALPLDAPGTEVQPSGRQRMDSAQERLNLEEVDRNIAEAELRWSDQRTLVELARERGEETDEQSDLLNAMEGSLRSLQRLRASIFESIARLEAQTPGAE
jgi:hypothetical protein